MLFCTYKYSGLADGDETAFASNLALQAYFEGRTMSEEDMKQCVNYWRENVSDINSPRGVCCEPFSIPCCSGASVYKRFCQCKRTIPKNYKKTEELDEARPCMTRHTSALRTPYGPIMKFKEGQEPSPY